MRLTNEVLLPPICNSSGINNTTILYSSIRKLISHYSLYISKRNTMPQKTCLECGEAIIGRSDKKFCSDLCRNSYNNKVNADANNYVRNTNNALRRNRKILEDICHDDKSKTTRNTLLDRGFDFSLITNIRTTQKGSTYYFVYEYGYLELDNDFFLVVKDNKVKTV